MGSRPIGICAIAAWSLICGAAGARAETSEAAGAATAVQAAAPYYYRDERYGDYAPRRYAWRPWYAPRSEDYAPNYRRYAPRYDGPSRYSYAQPYRSYRSAPYERRYYAPRYDDRRYDHRRYDDRRYDDRRYDDWTLRPRPALPRWAGASRDYDGPPGRGPGW